MRINAEFLKEYVVRLNDVCKGRYLNHPDFLTSSSLFFRISSQDDQVLAISLDNQFPRIYLSKMEHQNYQAESHFFTYLRRELNNAFLEDIKIVNDDMIVELDLSIINKVYKEEARKLVLELIPHHPNMILLDKDNKIIELFRPTSLLAKRPLFKNLVYEAPEKPKGIESPLNLSFKEYEDYSISLEAKIFEGRKNEQFGNYIKQLKRRIKSSEKKERAILLDIKKAESHLHDSLKGDIIYTCFNEIKPGQSKLIYEGEVIELDPSISPSSNAQRYYHLEKKAKATISNASSNLERVHKELDELKATLLLLLEGDDATLLRWMKEKKLSKANHEKKFNSLTSKELPYRVTYNGTTYLFGKNATQNRYLTFFLSRAKNHLWLHIEGETGSHLLIQKDNPSEEEILLAAEMVIALNHQEDGVVQIASRGSIRQGNKLGQVILKEYKVKRVDQVSTLAKELITKANKY